MDIIYLLPTGAKRSQAEGSPSNTQWIISMTVIHTIWNGSLNLKEQLRKSVSNFAKENSINQLFGPIHQKRCYLKRVKTWNRDL